MLLEQEIAEQALANLKAHTGIEGKWLGEDSRFDRGIDGQVLIHLNGNQLRFKAEVEREFREYQMNSLVEQAAGCSPLLMIADRLYPVQKARLREHQIFYLDAAGNSYISHEEILLWIEGQKGVYNGIKAVRTNRAFTKAGRKVVLALPQNLNAIN